MPSTYCFLVSTYRLHSPLYVAGVLASSTIACGKALLDSGIPVSAMSRLFDGVKSKSADARELFTFFSNVAYNAMLKDWEAKEVVPTLLNLWPTIAGTVCVSVCVVYTLVLLCMPVMYAGKLCVRKFNVCGYLCVLRLFVCREFECRVSVLLCECLFLFIFVLPALNDCVISPDCTLYFVGVLF